MNIKSGTVQGKRIPTWIGLGTLLGFSVLLIGVTILTWLLSAERITVEAIGYGVLIILLLSTITASGVTARMTGQHILPVSIGTSVCLMLVLMGMNALFFDGNYEGVGVTLLTVIGVGIGVALVELKRRNKSKLYRKKR